MSKTTITCELCELGSTFIRVEVDNLDQCSQIISRLRYLDDLRKILASDEIPPNRKEVERDIAEKYVAIKDDMPYIDDLVCRLEDKKFLGVQNVTLIDSKDKRKRRVYSAWFLTDCFAVLAFAFHTLTRAEEPAFAYCWKVEATIKQRVKSNRDLAKGIVKLAGAWPDRQRFADILSSMIEKTEGCDVLSGFRKPMPSKVEDVHQSTIFACIVLVEYGYMLNERKVDSSCESFLLFNNWLLAGLWVHIFYWMSNMMQMEVKEKKWKPAYRNRKFKAIE